MGIFDFFTKKRREQRRKLRELKSFSSVFSTLDRLAGSGLLAWDQQHRRLFVMQPLAVVMMKSAASWQNFVQNCFQWTYFKACQQAWDDFLLKEELAAVRKASVGEKHQSVQLSRDDVERIRRARRAEIVQSDMEPPTVAPFEIFIMPDTTEVAPKPIGVGFFDPETNDMEMAPWSEVEPLLQKSSEE